MKTIRTGLTAFLLFGTSCLLPAQVELKDPPVEAKLGDANFPKPRPSKRHDAKVKAIKSGEYDLVLIGDSITHFIGDAGGRWEPVKAVWKKYYAPHKSINLGYSAYRTENILWNLQNGELEFTKPPKVFRILIGTNNLDDQHYKTTHTATEVFHGTKAIVDEIRTKFPTSKVLILRILPSGGAKDSTTYKKRVYCRSEKALKALADAGQMTASLADGKNVFWMDINAIFLKKDGTINAELMPDLIHPNAAGHELMAKTLEPTLMKLLSGDVKSLKAKQTIKKAK